MLVGVRLLLVPRRAERRQQHMHICTFLRLCRVLCCFACVRWVGVRLIVFHIPSLSHGAPTSPTIIETYAKMLFRPPPSDTEVKRVMEMDENVLQDFLKERAAEVQHASKVIAETIVEDKTKTGESNFVLKGRGIYLRHRHDTYSAPF